MAVTADVVQVRLEANTRQYEQNLRRAEQVSTSAFGRIQTGALRASTALSTSFAGFAGAFAGVAAVQGSLRLVDAATAIGNSLRVAGLEGAELTRVYDDLFASAQRNAAPIQSLAQLYGRVAIVQNELGVSTEELLGLTDNVAKALRVAGTDAQSASGALLQLSQALGSGVVRAEEFNSILEGALPIAQAAAAGLEEAGGSVARLRQLVVEGRVSSEAFFRALEAGSYILDERLVSAEATVSQSFVRLQNVLIDVAGKFNEGTGASAALSGGLDNLGEVIASVADFSLAAVGPVQQLIDTIGGGVGQVRDLANEFARLTGLEQIGFRSAQVYNDLQIPGLSAGSSLGGRIIDQTFSLLGQTPQDEELARLLTGEDGPAPLKVTVEADRPTVSLSDYAPPTPTGTGRSAAANAAQRERQAVLDLIDTLEFERGLIGQTAREREIANALRQAGSAATEEQIARIRELVAATYDEQQAFDQLNMSAEQWADTVESATRGFIDDLIEGKSAAEAFANVLSNIGSQLISTGISSLFGTGGFNLAGLFGGTPTRATGGPVYAGTPTLVGERGPEIFVPSGPGKIVPNSQVGGGGNVTFAPVIDARGADVAAVARLERAVQSVAADVIPAIRREMATANRKGRPRG